MQIIISPAKKMVEDRDSLAPRSVPQFLPQTRQLLKVLRAMSPQELQRLWGCNDAIARLNVQRLETQQSLSQVLILLPPELLSVKSSGNAFRSTM